MCNFLLFPFSFATISRSFLLNYGCKNLSSLTWFLNLSRSASESLLKYWNFTAIWTQLREMKSKLTRISSVLRVFLVIFFRLTSSNHYNLSGHNDTESFRTRCSCHCWLLWMKVDNSPSPDIILVVIFRETIETKAWVFAGKCWKKRSDFNLRVMQIVKKAWRKTRGGFGWLIWAVRIRKFL